MKKAWLILGFYAQLPPGNFCRDFVYLSLTFSFSFSLEIWIKRCSLAPKCHLYSKVLLQQYQSRQWFCFQSDGLRWFCIREKTRQSTKYRLRLESCVLWLWSVFGYFISGCKSVYGYLTNWYHHSNSIPKEFSIMFGTNCPSKAVMDKLIPT